VSAASILEESANAGFTKLVNKTEKTKDVSFILNDT
jgi:hypothetical protein